jgi:hypothetical protein
VQIFWLTDELGYCDQPTFRDLKELGSNTRIHTLIDVRLPNERPIGGAAAAARHGLHYVHVAVPAVKDLEPRHLHEIGRALRGRDARPAVICSGEGARAAAIALLLVAMENAKDRAWLERWAARLGLDLPDRMLAILPQPARPAT